MNSKFYISYDAARLLKEKGYDVCFTHLYKSRNELRTTSLVYDMDLMSNEELHTNHYAAPTKAEAIDWLESKGIVVELIYDNDELQKDDSEWVYYIYQYDNDGLLDETMSSWGMGEIYDTRLEAEEAAIIKALELL